MLSWASSKLTALTDTLAPPPDGAGHRFATALSHGDEATALSCLSGTAAADQPQPLSPHAVLDARRGSTPLHLAARHGCLSVFDHLVITQGLSPELFDSAGNTPLHYAASSSASSSSTSSPLTTVRHLLSNHSCSVTVRNAQGQTPYDVATVDSVRQYLLPIQLQAETQAQLDSGNLSALQASGVDLAGLGLVKKSNVAPPPIMSMGGAGGGAGHNGISGATGGGGGAVEALMSPPPMARGLGPAGAGANANANAGPAGTPAAAVNAGGIPGGVPAPSAPSGAVAVTPPMPMPQMPVPQMPGTPSAGLAAATPTARPAAAAAASPFGTPQPPTPSPAPAVAAATTTTTTAPTTTPTTAPTTTRTPTPSVAQPSSNGGAAPAPSPSSSSGGSGYARSGYSSAAVLPARSKYRPDGFHSSSSDVGLQKKYGHTTVGTTVAPPPTSGNGIGIGNGNGIGNGIGSGGGGGGGGGGLNSGAAMAATTAAAAAPNPFAASGGGATTMAAGVGAGAGGVARYPTYCAVTGAVGTATAAAVAPTSGSGGGGPQQQQQPPQQQAVVPAYNPYGFGGGPAAAAATATPSPSAAAAAAPVAATPVAAVAASTPATTTTTTTTPVAAAVDTNASLALPDGWVEYSDPTTGKPYYYHAASGQTVWDRPVAAATTAAEAAASGNATDAAAAQAAVAVAAVTTPTASEIFETNPSEPEAVADVDTEIKAEEDGALPDGWTELSDPSSGNPYYYCAATGETSWTRPAKTVPATATAITPSATDAADAVQDGPKTVDQAPKSSITEPIQKEESPSTAEEAIVQDATDDIATTTDSAVPAIETIADDTIDQKEGEEEPSTVVQEKGEEVANSDPVREEEIDTAQEALESVSLQKEEDVKMAGGNEEVPVLDETKQDMTPSGITESAIGDTIGVLPEQAGEDTTEGVVSVDQKEGGNEEQGAKVKPSPDIAALPDGWAEATDPSSGNVYFYNSVSGAVSWERPSSNTGGTDAAKEEKEEDAAVSTEQMNGASVARIGQADTSESPSATTTSTASAADIFSSPPSSGAPAVTPTSTSLGNNENGGLDAPPILPSVGTSQSIPSPSKPTSSGLGDLPPPPVMSFGATQS